ncbi:MAG: hypothetical protein ACFCU1_08055 [Sumerlaeia bacterium]
MLTPKLGVLPVRLSQKQIDYIAFLVLRKLKEKPAYEIKDANAVVAAVRTEIAANLRQEQALLVEAEARIAPFRQQVLKEGADYQELLQKAVKALAKEKGLVL